MKACGGPFTAADEVENYMKATEDFEERIKRLYVESRYAKNMCMSLKHSSSVFRIQKSWFFWICCKSERILLVNKSTLTMNDLTSVLRKMSGMNGKYSVTLYENYK